MVISFFLDQLPDPSNTLTSKGKVEEETEVSWRCWGIFYKDCKQERTCALLYFRKFSLAVVRMGVRGQE